VILVGLAATVALSWTNPLDADLAGVQIFASADGETLRGAIYLGRTSDEAVPPIIVPGGRDSAQFALPCRSSTRLWRFWAKAFDKAGNWSLPSNVVEVVR